MLDIIDRNTLSGGAACHQKVFVSDTAALLLDPRQIRILAGPFSSGRPLIRT